MQKYSKAIEKNLRHMGTLVTEWSAVPIVGITGTDGENGKQISMPVFDFPDGYSHAPSLYKSNSEPVNCEWCGTRIKKLFWIKNDQKKWTMFVGSECITHFGEGKSGNRLEKEQIWDLNRDLLRKAIKARDDLSSELRKTVDNGYGSNNWKIDRNSAFAKKAIKTYFALQKVIGRRTADSKKPDFDTSSTNTTISRWVNANKDEVSGLVKKASELIEQMNF